MADGGSRMASPAYHDLMQIGRRELIVAGAAAVGLARFDALVVQEGREMYGLIGKMTTVPGQRDAFVRILLGGVGDMPGCLSYVVARDPTDENALWITEVWDSQASHEASLKLPAVRDAIARGKPLIASFDNQIITTPVGGHGLTIKSR
jgi:quinol monooxygenase YgiN